MATSDAAKRRKNLKRQTGMPTGRPPRSIGNRTLGTLLEKGLLHRDPEGRFYLLVSAGGTVSMVHLHNLVGISDAGISWIDTKDTVSKTPKIIEPVIQLNTRRADELLNGDSV